MSQFKKWLVKELKSNSLKPWQRDFADDVRVDKSFRNFKTFDELKNYISRKSQGRADGDVISAARECYELWQATDPKANVDGFSAKHKEQIRKATRQVWSWSYPRRICVARATDSEGFVYCENSKCKSKGKPVPKIFVDHIKPVGAVDKGYLERLFCPSSGLQALCKKCHSIKTEQEAAQRAAKKRKPDFFDSF